MRTRSLEVVSVFHVRDDSGFDCRGGSREGEMQMHLGCVLKMVLIGFAYKLEVCSEEKENKWKVSS